MNPIPPQPSSPGPASGFAESAEKEAARQPRKSGGGGGGGGGFIRFIRKLLLLLLLAAAGAGAYVYYNPATISVVASFIRPAPADSVDSVDPADPAPNSAPAPDSPAPAASDAPKSQPVPAAPAKAADDAKAQIALLSGELAAMRKQVARIQSRLNQVDAAVRTTRAADSANIRLLLAGLLLESNGDTQSAASALRRIADSESAGAEAVSPDIANLARAEAVRLEQTPARQRVLSQIAELRRMLEKTPDSAAAAPDAPDSWTDGVGGFLRGVFNVSRRDQNQNTPGQNRQQILNHLAQMEFYLAANNRGQYRNSLDSAERLWTAEKSRMENGGGEDGTAANIDLKFRILREFGAPDYRLNLPLDKP